MSITFTPAAVRDRDRAEFIRFMTRDRFPFHAVTEPSEDQVARDIDAGRHDGPRRVSLWVEHAEHGRIGMATLSNTGSLTATFDLRLVSRYRGRGLGAEILRALTAVVFEQYPALRFEGRTREDNLAMRKTFAAAGFVKEAHLRDSWLIEGGEALAVVVYAILRRDWAAGTTTTVPWDDLPA